MLGDNNPDDYDWFYYPRGGTTTEDVQFSLDVGKAGFKMGATTAVTAPHLAEVTTGWETYQNYLDVSGQRTLLDRYEQLGRMVADFTGETPEQVVAKSAQGGRNVRDAWEKAKPQTAQEVEAFYGNPDNGYLYDLLKWNCSPLYQEIITPLYQVKNSHCLVIGAGLGVEVEALCDGARDVEVYELDGVLKEFCRKRFCDNEVTFVNSIHPANYDLIVAVDVLEHIHPDKIGDTLQAVDQALIKGGILHCHNNWGQQDIYPMHYDHSEKWAKFTHNRYQQIGAYQWRKL
jgi:hypothetical protein